MKRCANCNTMFLLGAREFQGQQYCSQQCVEFAETPIFCTECQTDTIDVSTGNLVRINFIGEGFLGSSNKCPVCYSSERYMFFFLGIPLLPLGKWKVKYAKPGWFMTRKIMNTTFPDVARQHLPKGAKRMSPLLWLLVGALLLAIVFPAVYTHINK